MKNAIEYFQSRRLLGIAVPRGEMFAAEHCRYLLTAEPAELTMPEARQLSCETFDEVLEVKVRLNDSYAYMNDDIGARLDNVLGKAVAAKFGLETDGEDKAQFLYAKVATLKQADNFADAVAFY